MEFMAIVDAKARAPSACAAIGIYENGDLGVAARQVDKQLEGLITRLKALAQQPVSAQEQADLTQYPKTHRGLIVGLLGGGSFLLGQASKNAGADDLAALTLFVREENEHARLLACMVDRLGGTLVKRHYLVQDFARIFASHFALVIEADGKRIQMRDSRLYLTFQEVAHLLVEDFRGVYVSSSFHFDLAAFDSERWAC